MGDRRLHGSAGSNDAWRGLVQWMVEVGWGKAHHLRSLITGNAMDDCYRGFNLMYDNHGRLSSSCTQLHGDVERKKIKALM